MNYQNITYWLFLELVVLNFVGFILLFFTDNKIWFNLLFVISLIITVLLFLLYLRSCKSINKIKKRLSALRRGSYDNILNLSEFDISKGVAREFNLLSQELNNEFYYFHDLSIAIQRITYLMQEESKKSVDELYALTLEMAEKDYNRVLHVDELIKLVKHHLEHQSYSSNNVDLISYKIEQFEKQTYFHRSDITRILFIVSELADTIEDQSKEIANISEKLRSKVEQYDNG